MAKTWTSLVDLRNRLSELLSRRHPGMVSRLEVGLLGDTLVLEGEVASEACRSAAKRLALSFDGVFKVRNELLVAAFLQPAGVSNDEDSFFIRAPAWIERQNQAMGQEKRSLPRRSPEVKSLRPKPDREPARRVGTRKKDSVRSTASSSDAQVEVFRQPVISGSAAPAPEEWIEVEVGLVEGVQGNPAISLGSFPASWQEIEVRVQLIAPWADRIEEGRPFVVVRHDGSCEPARFRCRTSAGFVEGSAAEIHAIFVHGTRVCGHVVDDLAPATADAIASAAGLLDLRTVRIADDEIGPSLSVSIARTGRGKQSWTWAAMLPGASMNGAGTVALDSDEEAFANDLLRACPGMDGNRHRRILAGLGERLWQATPPEFKAIYMRCREALGPRYPIQFLTDDPHVPWEMMKPDDGATDHLFICHPVTRWPLTRSGRRHGRLNRGEVLSFVPLYGPGRELPKAIQEGEWMRDQAGAIVMRPCVETFLEVLDGARAGPVGVLHFAGHGRVDTGLSDGGIDLEDGSVCVGEVDQSRVVLGARDRTLVVLNACETSAGARMLGMNVGWGAAIAAREFGGLIAPLWEVDDGFALDMVQQVLPALLDRGVSLGEAVSRSRATLCDRSPSAFAYLAHGDVMAAFRS